MLTPEEDLQVADWRERWRRFDRHAQQYSPDGETHRALKLASTYCRKQAIDVLRQRYLAERGNHE